jgi:membrane associated rhomboid family serine protease
MVQSYFILVSIHITVYLAESLFSLRKYTNQFDFSGDAFRRGKFYVGITSSFLHNSNEHVLEQVLALLIAGEAVERQLGSVMFIFTYILCGFVGCVSSWKMFKMYPPPHLRKAVSDRTMRAIVDGSPSRGK